MHSHDSKVRKNFAQGEQFGMYVAIAISIFQVAAAYGRQGRVIVVVPGSPTSPKLYFEELNLLNMIFFNWYYGGVAIGNYVFMKPDQYA